MLLIFYCRFPLFSVFFGSPLIISPLFARAFETTRINSQRKKLDKTKQPGQTHACLETSLSAELLSSSKEHSSGHHVPALRIPPISLASSILNRKIFRKFFSQQSFLVQILLLAWSPFVLVVLSAQGLQPLVGYRCHQSSNGYSSTSCRPAVIRVQYHLRLRILERTRWS